MAAVERLRVSRGGGLSELKTCVLTYALLLITHGVLRNGMCGAAGAREVTRVERSACYGRELLVGGVESSRK